MAVFNHDTVWQRRSVFATASVVTSNAISLKDTMQVTVHAVRVIEATEFEST